MSLFNFCDRFNCCHVSIQDKNEEIGIEQENSQAIKPVQQVKSPLSEIDPEILINAEARSENLTTSQVTNILQQNTSMTSALDKSIFKQKNVINYMETMINRKIDFQDFPRINLLVIESKELPKDTVFEIYPQGMIGSARKSLDGVTIFGTKQPDIQSKQLNVQQVDLIVPTSEYGFASNHFAIYFEPQPQKYFIADLNSGNGTFLLIDQPIIIQQDMLVQFGATLMQLKIDLDQSITIKYRQGVLKDQVFTFQAAQKEISIGRHSSSVIQVKEAGLSRIQCIIQFSNAG